jgi:hypothetical protein
MDNLTKGIVYEVIENGYIVLPYLGFILPNVFYLNVEDCLSDQFEEEVFISVLLDTKVLELIIGQFLEFIELHEVIVFKVIIE